MAEQKVQQNAVDETFAMFDPRGWEISGNVATTISGSNGIALGSKQISEGVHEWVILFEGIRGCCCDFGISTNESENIFKKSNNTECNMYPIMISYHSRGNGAYNYHNLDGNNRSEKLNSTTIKSGDKIRIVLNYAEKHVSFYHNNQLMFVKSDLPIGTDKKYRLLIDDDANNRNKFTILQSNGDRPKITLKSILSDLNIMSEELKKFDKTKLEKMSIKDLAKIKEDTIKFEEECKEFEQNYETFQEQVNQFVVAVDKELNPDAKDYRVM